MSAASAVTATVHPVRTGSGQRKKVALAAVLLGMVISAFEGTVVTTAMPTITGALHGRELFAWVFTAFLLASMIGVLLAGKFGDHFGRRPTFLGGMALFLGGSALCGVAPSMPWLITFRAVQGLGAGALQPTTMTITADLFTLEQRAHVQSLITGVWGLANVLGPVIGGWIVSHASWRWVFLVNLPVGIVSAALLVYSYRDGERPHQKLEIAGPVLAGVAAALVLFALEPHAPRSLRLLSAALGAVTGGLFVLTQKRTQQPVVPFEYLGDRTVQTGLLGGAVGGALLYATATYVPLWISGRGHGPLAAGFALVPMLAAWAVGSTFGVKILIRGGMRYSCGAGFLVAALGAIALACCAAFDASMVWTLLSLALLGVGIGPAISTSVLGPQSVVPHHTRSIVTSAVYSTRMVGGAVAIALLDLLGRTASHALVWIAPLAIVGGVAVMALSPATPPGEEIDVRELSAAE
ncbi:MAG: MFS transporter [Myxococcaceae bacterium]|nr:MFS transporter [Myxococcaceae bacterium]